MKWQTAIIVLTVLDLALLTAIAVIRWLTRRAE